MWMLYQLNYEAKVCLTSSLSAVKNALSTDLWSKSTPRSLSCECSINWTMKQKFFSHPQSLPSRMLSQLTYEAQVTLALCHVNALSTQWTMKQKFFSHPHSLPSRMLSQLTYEAQVSLALCHVNALSTELWSKSTPHIFSPLWWMPYQLNYEAEVHLTSPLSVNALLTELWSRSTPHILAPLWWKLYQLNYEAKVRPTSSLHCDECSINWTMKQTYASHRRSNVMNARSNELWSKSTPHILALCPKCSRTWLNYEAKVRLTSSLHCDECPINWTMKQKYTSPPRSLWMLY